MNIPIAGRARVPSGGLGGRQRRLKPKSAPSLLVRELLDWARRSLPRHAFSIASAAAAGMMPDNGSVQGRWGADVTSRTRPDFDGMPRPWLPYRPALGGWEEVQIEALLSAAPDLDGQARARIRLHGEIPSAINPPSGCVFHTRCPRKIGRVCEEQEPLLQETGVMHQIRCHLPVAELGRRQPDPESLSQADIL